MVERIVDEVVVVIRADPEALEAELERAKQSIRDFAESELSNLQSQASSITGNAGSGGGFFGNVAGSIGGSIQGLVTRQISSLVREGVSSLFGGRTRTTTTTESRGGGSQFSNPEEQGRTASGSGGSSSQAQSSALLAAAVRKGDRNT